MSDIDRSLGRLEGKMDLMLINQVELKNTVTALHVRVDKHGKVIAWFLGGIAIIGVGIKLFGHKIKEIFTGV